MSLARNMEYPNNTRSSWHRNEGRVQQLLLPHLSKPLLVSQFLIVFEPDTSQKQSDDNDNRKNDEHAFPQFDLCYQSWQLPCPWGRLPPTVGVTP